MVIIFILIVIVSNLKGGMAIKHIPLGAKWYLKIFSLQKCSGKEEDDGEAHISISTINPLLPLHVLLVPG